jgi:O-antigen ligase
LLAIVLITGPAVLGAARLWIELPLLGVVALLFLIQGARLNGSPAGNAPRLIDMIDLSVVIFVLYAIVRWLTSPTEYFSRLEVMNIMAYATVFFTCRYGLVRRTHGLVLLWLLVVLGVAETAFGYYLSHYSNPNDPQSLWFLFGPSERLQLHYFPRWVGTYGCPNHYGSLLVMATGTAIAMGAFSKWKWPVRIILFYLAAMMMIGVIYSGSRGSWLALLASVGALTIFGLRHGTLRWWIPLTGYLLLVALFVAVVCYVPAIQTRFTDAVDTIENGTLNRYVRVELAQDALRIARDHPIFGTGPATFVFIHPRYQSNTFAFKAVLTHDDYLNCLDDYGLAGFGIALFFVIAVTLKFFRRLRADTRWQDRVLIAAGFAAWSAFLVHSTVDFNLHVPANALMLFALTGLGLRRTQGEKVVRQWGMISLAPLGRWLGLGLIALSLAYAVQVGRTALSDIIYETVYAKVSDQPTIQSIQDVGDALTFDRGNAQALVLLGDLYRYRASREDGMENRTTEGQKALAAYQEALKANPLDDTIQGRMGLTFDAMRRYSEAFFCYATAVKAEPHNGQFWNVLGNHYWQRGMLVKAEQAYLMAAQCPHGFEGSADAAQELRKVLDARGVPAPAPGTNPLDVPAETPTTP